MLGLILIFTFGASILSLLLVAILLLHKTFIHKISFFLVSFAAGALFSTAMLDTLKEALEVGGEKILLWVTLSFAGFFLIERLFLSIHHHDKDEESIHMPASLLLFGDGLHNFIDGVSIAASFMVNFQLGFITALTVFIHEIPHELGDFGILIHKGWGRRKVLWFNAITGLTAIFGAILAYYLGQQFKEISPLLLSITTGNFIYLSATDLLPEIHKKSTKGFAAMHVGFFLLGILLVAFLIKTLDH